MLIFQSFIAHTLLLLDYFLFNSSVTSMWIARLLLVLPYTAQHYIFNTVVDERLRGCSRSGDRAFVCFVRFCMHQSDSEALPYFV